MNKKQANVKNKQQQKPAAAATTAAHNNNAIYERVVRFNIYIYIRSPSLSSSFYCYRCHTLHMYIHAAGHGDVWYRQRVCSNASSYLWAVAAVAVVAVAAVAACLPARSRIYIFMRWFGYFLVCVALCFWFDDVFFGMLRSAYASLSSAIAYVLVSRRISVYFPFLVKNNLNKSLPHLLDLTENFSILTSTEI